MEEQLESSCEEVHFSREEVVWAKITGYPWWPALVTHAPSEGGAFRVDFFADNTHAFVSRSKLAKYQSLRGEVDLHKHMKKGLRRAIATADQAIRDRLGSFPDLPHCRAPVEAPPAMQKQLLQLPFIETTPLQEHPHPLYAAEKDAEPQQQYREAGEAPQESAQESVDSPPTPQYSLQRRKKYVSMLLRKYELDNLTRAEDGEMQRPPCRVRERGQAKKRQATSRRDRNKAKKISKAYHQTQQDQHTQQRPSTLTLLARRLHNFLRGKPELCEAQRREITLSLARQVQGHHARLETAAEQVVKLLKWLQITPATTIASYYESWSSFQNEKEKASSMTTDD